MPAHEPSSERFSIWLPLMLSPIRAFVLSWDCNPLLSASTRPTRNRLFPPRPCPCCPGRPLGAVEDYTAAISLYTDPADKAEMYSNRGFNLDVQGDLDAAIEDYTQAIAFYPDPEA